MYSSTHLDRTRSEPGSEQIRPCKQHIRHCTRLWSFILAYNDLQHAKKRSTCFKFGLVMADISQSTVWASWVLTRAQLFKTLLA